MQTLNQIGFKRRAWVKALLIIRSKIIKTNSARKNPRTNEDNKIKLARCLETAIRIMQHQLSYSKTATSTDKENLMVNLRRLQLELKTIE